MGMDIICHLFQHIDFPDNMVAIIALDTDYQ